MMTGKAMILDKTGESQECNVYAIEAVESATSRFFLAKNTSYIIIFTKVEKEDDALTLHVQRGMLIAQNDLESVKTNFSFTAERALHKQLSMPSGNTPTNFSDLAKELDAAFQTPRKRAATFGAPTEEVSQVCAFTTMPSPKKPRTT